MTKTGFFANHHANRRPERKVSIVDRVRLSRALSKAKKPEDCQLSRRTLEEPWVRLRKETPGQVAADGGEGPDDPPRYLVRWHPQALRTTPDQGVGRGKAQQPFLPTFGALPANTVAHEGKSTAKISDSWRTGRSSPQGARQFSLAWLFASGVRSPGRNKVRIFRRFLPPT